MSNYFIFIAVLKTYSGKYTIKNKEKYEGDPTNVVYRSMWERYCFQWCDNNEDVEKWSSEEIIIPYFYEVDKKYHRYFVDLKIKYKSGETVIIEIKPEKQTLPPRGPTRSKKYITEAYTYIKNQNKWEAADSFAKDRKWKFQIWTEKTLSEKNIMPKTPGTLKKQKPLKPYRKKSKK
jgi:hypothetical protein